MFLELQKVKFICMARQKEDEFVPHQYKGNKLNVEYSIIAQSVKEAAACFKDGVKRLLDVNNWQHISKPQLSVFSTD